MTALVRRKHAATTDSPNLRANGESSPRALMRDAAKAAADLGLAMSPCRIRRLVTRYLREGHTTDFRTWFLGYADPTGEQAVRNVLRDTA